jgi:hypothetical protein
MQHSLPYLLFSKMVLDNNVPSIRTTHIFQRHQDPHLDDVDVIEATISIDAANAYVDAIALYNI